MSCLKERCDTSSKGTRPSPLSQGEDDGMVRGPMKWVDPHWNSRGEGGHLALTDAEQRKCGEQNRLETCVVHTVNDVHSSSMDDMRASFKRGNLDEICTMSILERDHNAVNPWY